jgi:hypothetical protein
VAGQHFIGKPHNVEVLINATQTLKGSLKHRATGFQISTNYRMATLLILATQMDPMI